jgi:phage terminase small subunit
MAKGLTAKQRAFCEAYAVNGRNGAEAAKAAGYSGASVEVLGQQAYQALKSIEVQRYLATLLSAADRRLLAGEPEPKTVRKLSAVRAKLYDAVAEAGGGKIEREWVEPADETGKKPAVKVKQVVDGLSAAAELLAGFDKRQDRKAKLKETPSHTTVNVLALNRLDDDTLRKLQAATVEALPE